MSATLLQAKNSGIPAAVNIAKCSPEFLQLLNDAQEDLAMMGRWWGSCKRMVICATGGCIVWPREVMTVEGLNVCNWGAPLRNRFYEFMENRRSPKATDCCLDTQRQLLDHGTVCTFRSIPTASKIRLYPGDITDVGQEVIVQGLDVNGVPIRTNLRTADDPDWIEGEKLVLADPFVDSVNTFAAGDLTGVQKQLTNQRVLAFAVDVDTGIETQIATWQPSEENPSYRRTLLTNFPRAQHVEAVACNGDRCQQPVSCQTGEVRLEAYVRLQFIPARIDSDWLYIGNLGALRKMMVSLSRERANDLGAAERFKQMALADLRNELDAYEPPQRMVVNVETFGTSPISRVIRGFI